MLINVFPSKAEEEKAKAAVLFAGKEKGGAKVSVVPSKEKKTKLKRRDEVEPPVFIGKPALLYMRERENLDIQ